jgi:hypothetical protein
MNIRILTLASLFAASASNEPAQAQESQVRKANTPYLRLNLATEDARQTKTKVEIQTGEMPPKVIKQMDDVLTGSTNLPLSGIPDGDYLIFLSSPGYAAQWQPLTLKQEKPEPDNIKVKLFRKRYVVLRYVFNTSGGREFSGKDIKEGRAAVAHWGSLPYFQQDWQIWQKSSGEDMFGETAYLDFHRFSDGFGFAKVPKGVAFDDLKEAPVQAEYKCRSTKAEKGLILFCRVEADRKDGLGYGKVVVENVTETPPPGVKVIESP